ncbi:MAG: type III-B CRISPR module-associated protein Cmr3 [Fimbriimonadales bacterium]|nr:type III-B CRISPR module-associated protein Cmr3 [Fimbriimonadales bacterium]
MKRAVYALSSLEPLVFGDARPFAPAAGSRSRTTLEMPHPSTLYGALVKELFSQRLRTDPDATRKRLRDFILSGPFLLVDGRPAYPTPACWIPAASNGNGLRALAVVPSDAAEGCDWPEPCAAGLAIPEMAAELRTKAALPPRVSGRVLADLLNPQPSAAVEIDELLPAPPRQRTTHVAIHPESGKARQGQLYSAEGIRLQRTLDNGNGFDSHSFEVLFALESPFEEELPESIHLNLGGERRNACATRLEGGREHLQCIEGALPTGPRVLLSLATPGQFEHGWLPRWLAEGMPCPNVGLRFRLVSAAVPGFEAVSGFGQTERNFGPKPALWLAQAGSVYFLEAVDPAGNPLGGDDLADLRRRLAEAWLKPVSDQPKFRRKGFGAALWGSWTPAL